MPKPTISRIFLGSLAAMLVGVGFVLASLIAVLATGNWVVSETESATTFHLSSTAAAMFGFTLVGVIAMIAGIVGQFIAWIGALMNTSRLEDKAWFVLLLVLGLLSFGFVAMLVYVVAGPDALGDPTSRSHGSRQSFA